MINSSSKPTRELETQENQPSQILHSIINKTVGNIIGNYLLRLKEKSFGIVYNENENIHMIYININNIISNDQIYKGTPGLWKLLSYKMY